MHPLLVLDVRTLNSDDVGSDHKLLLIKIKLKIKRHNKRTEETLSEQKFNIELLGDESTRQLYKQRLKEKIEVNYVCDEDNI